MKKEMLINVLQPEECRIAILEDGVLEELYVERTSHESYVGNIYKGRIVNIEPSIQAAFVDFGVGRNGFLHVSDVEPAYYRHLTDSRPGGGRDSGRDGGRRSRTRISRPGTVIPSPKDRLPAAPIEDTDEPEDILSMADLPPDLGAAEDITIVDELLLEQEADWGVESIAEDEETAEQPAAETSITSDTGLTVDDAQSAVEPAAEEPAAEEPAAELSAPVDEPAAVEELAPADEPVLPAVLEEEAEAEPAKTRRRKTPARPRKGRSSKKKTEAETTDDSAEEAAEKEAPAAEESEEEASAPESPAGDESNDMRGERPRPMGSAERRTREGDAEADDSDEEEAADEIEAAEPVQQCSTPEITDEELSFSLRRPEPVEPEEELADNEKSLAEAEPEEVETLSEMVREEMAEPDLVGEALSDLPAERPQRRGPRDRRNNGGGGRDRRNNGGGGRDRRGGRNGMSRPKPLIQDIFKRGQEVLVQVIKEGIGTKGPTLSTYISIAGRYLVLMPGLNRIGVSRKITDEEQRRRLREILNELKPPKGLGFIIRTAGLDRTKKELQRDLAYLARLWQVVVRRIRKFKSPAEIYQESDMITRTIRDTFTSEIQTIYVDESKAFEHAQEFLQIVMPRYANRIKLYKDSAPIFHKYGIEEEIARMHQRHVPLPNGGSIVIDQTEALVAIDVNSGNFRADNNAEETAYQMNLLAAKEIGRQLRLRDLGGVIVNDFIDMREEKHRRGVERAMRDAVRRDRARTKVLKISAFGIIEMTRQRIRPSLKRSVYQDCPHCSGSGQIKTVESMSIDVMRMVQLASSREVIKQIHVRVHEEVGNYLHNRKRRELAQLEEQTGTSIHITGVHCSSPEFLEFVCYDSNNNEIRFPAQTEARPPSRRR